MHSPSFPSLSARKKYLIRCNIGSFDFSASVVIGQLNATLSSFCFFVFFRYFTNLKVAPCTFVQHKRWHFWLNLVESTREWNKTDFHVLFNGERWTVLDSVLKLGLRFVLRLGITKDQSAFLIEYVHVMPRRPCWCPQLILRDFYVNTSFSFGWKTCSLITWVKTLYRVQ